MFIEFLASLLTTLGNLSWNTKKKLNARQSPDNSRIKSEKVALQYNRDVQSWRQEFSPAVVDRLIQLTNNYNLSIAEEAAQIARLVKN